MAPALGQLDERSRIETALGYIPADDRDLWLRIGMAIKSALGEAGFALWDDWSRSSERYREADARTVWRSIDADGGVTIGTLFFEAAKYGYVQGESGKTDRAAVASAPARPAPGGPPDNPPEQPCNSATVAAYAEWKKLPEAFLRYARPHGPALPPTSCAAHTLFRPRRRRDCRPYSALSGQRSDSGPALRLAPRRQAAALRAQPARAAGIRGAGRRGIGLPHALVPRGAGAGRAGSGYLERGARRATPGGHRAGLCRRRAGSGR